MAMASSVLGPCLVLLLGHGPVKPTNLKLKLNLDLRAQGQIIALVAVANAQRLSGAEVEANLSVKSMGLAVGAGYERLRLRTPGGAVETDAGFGLLAIQWRFVALLHRTLFEWFDPHLDFGGLLGGAHAERAAGGWAASGSAFRGVFFIGGGLDVRLAPWKTHVVLTARYRYHVVQTPAATSAHTLLVGLGVRLAE